MDPNQPHNPVPPVSQPAVPPVPVQQQAPASQTAPPPTTPPPPQKPPVADTQHPFPPPVREGKNWFKIVLIVSLILIALLLAVGGIVLGQTVLKAEKQEEKPMPTPTGMLPSPSPTPITLDITEAQYASETATWKVYKINAINAELKLPPELSNLGTLTEKILRGDKGTQLYVSFTNSKMDNKFLIGTTSPDYQQGRGGQFIDHQGYKIENGKYYARFIGDSYSAIQKQQYNPQLIKNSYGVNILKLKGYMDPQGMPTLLEDKHIGALINTNNTTYPGITIEMELSDGLTEEVFNKILSTFKFTNQTTTIPSPTVEVYCTQEVKMCPDGSAVGRTGPNCEFAACPQ